MENLVENNVVIAGLFSLITAGVAYLAAVKQFNKTTKDNDKSIFIAAVTNQRAKWREELRDSISSFCSECVKENINIAELLKAKTQIILRLNPRARDDDGLEKHQFDHEIISCTSTIYQKISSKDSENIEGLIRQLQISAQELLKQEWEKSKEEAVSGIIEHGLSNDVLFESEKKPDFLESFLRVDSDDFKLKFVFDNLRNYAIAGGVFYAGVYIIKNGSFISNQIPFAGITLGMFLAISAFLLMALNLCQGVLATASRKPKMIPYMILNVVVALSVMDLFWFWVINYQNG